MERQITAAENEKLCFQVCDLGAELQSMVWKSEKLELLWQGDRRWWPDRSPVLFPAVGDWKDNRYCYEGDWYEMPLHGFARFSVFRLSERLDHKLVYQLRANEDTKIYYPFDFIFTITYEAAGSQLNVRKTVENISDRCMPFSVGGHVGFRVPFKSGEDYADYYLEFEKKETACRYPLIGGRVLGAPVPCLEHSGILELSKDMFRRGAYNFKGLRSEWIALKNRRNSYSVEMAFPGIKYFSLWSVPGADFLCLEPCNGVAASEDEGYDILKKKGICVLKPGAKSVFSYVITVKES